MTGALLSGLVLLPAAAAEADPLTGLDLTLRRTSYTAAQAGPVVVPGSSGNDTLRVDFSAGNPVPGGLVFDGGAQTGGAGDALELVGHDAGTITVVMEPDSADGGHNGTILLDEDGAGGAEPAHIQFRDLEPVSVGPNKTFVLFQPKDGKDNQVILTDDGDLGNGRSRILSGNNTFEMITFNNPSVGLAIDADNAGFNTDPTENVTVRPHTITTPILIDGGQGSNTLRLEPGATLNAGGYFDGLGGTDTIDFSALTTPVAVNLGSAPAGLAATLGPDQVATATGSAGSGSASLTYDTGTRTLGINLSVAGIDPATVTGLHLHAGPHGSDGPTLLDLGTGSLTPSGTGFTYAGTGIALPDAHEATLLGGLTYLDVHTSALAGGAIRGQVLATGAFADTPGSASHVGPVRNVERVTGGSAADSLVGTTGVNTIVGGAGDDTIVGSRGKDTVTAGAGNDVMAWNHGDGAHVLRGEGDTDRVAVNGDPVGADRFSVGVGTSGRVDLDRTSSTALSLDIGTTEAVGIAGRDGADTIVARTLTGIADLESLEGFGLAGDDRFVRTLSGPHSLAVTGGAGTDTLEVRGGTTNDVLAVGTGAGGSLAVTRSSPAPAETLPAGQVERLIVDSGTGNDSLTLPSLTGLPFLQSVALWGKAGADTFTVAPGDVPLQLDGAAGTDSLVFDAGCAVVTQSSVSLSAEGSKPTLFAGMESVFVPTTFRFGSPTATVGEKAGSWEAKVVRSGSGAASVIYSTVDDAATAGSDFTATSGILSFAAGETSQTVSVSILDDSAGETDEPFGFSLSGPSAGARICAPGTATVTIDDDEQPADVGVRGTNQTGAAPPPPAPAPSGPDLGAGTRVPGAGDFAPAFSILRATASRRNGSAKLTVSLPGHGSVSVKAVARGRTVATGRLGVVEAGRQNLTLRPTAAGRRMLRASRRRRVRVRVTATYRPVTGARQTARRLLTLRLGPRG